MSEKAEVAVKSLLEAALEDVMDQLAPTIQQYEQHIADLRQQKDQAYKERDMVLALAASAIDALASQRVVRAWLGRHQENDPNWEDDWRNVVFIQLPTGQLSWHIHDSELPWFAGLPREGQAWDGHTTEEKYQRLLQFVMDI